jgi:hypothetical protein
MSASGSLIESGWSFRLTTRGIGILQEPHIYNCL